MIKSILIFVLVATCFLFACSKQDTSNPNQVVNNQIRTDSVSGILYKDCSYTPDAGAVFSFQVVQNKYNVYGPVYQQQLTTDVHGRFKAAFTFNYEQGSDIILYANFGTYNMYSWPFASIKSNRAFVENDTAYIPVRLIPLKQYTSKDTLYYQVAGYINNYIKFEVGPFKTSMLSELKIPRADQLGYGYDFDTTRMEFFWSIGRRGLDANGQEMDILCLPCSPPDTTILVLN